MNPAAQTKSPKMMSNKHRLDGRWSSPARALVALSLVALAIFAAVALDSQQADAHHAVSVSGGDESGCAIDTGGELECWGSVVYGWTVLPAGRFKDVSTSDDHICAIRTGGELECWGDAGVVQHPLGRFSNISIGGRAPNTQSEHACAIKAGGELECWVYHDYEGYLSQTDLPSGRFSQVSAGYSHTCAIATGAELKCWSRDTYRSQTLVTDTPTGRFTEVSVGAFTACAITADGKLKCWGDAYGSGLNDAPEGRFTKVSVGASTACAISVEGELECWGDDRFSWTDTPTGRFHQISVRATQGSGEAGSHFVGDGVCAISARDDLECWNKVSYSQANVPSGGFSQVSIGEDHTCAVTSGGELECWGRNDDGQADAPSGRFNRVSAGEAYTCAITTGAELKCWGDEPYGIEDAPAGRFTDISVNDLHACAIETGGGLECWLIQYSEFSPFGWELPSPPSGRFSQVSAGWGHTCAITTGGEIECWGRNGDGQTDAPAGRFTQVSAGYYHTCAVTTGGAVQCWGSNYDGQADAPSGRFSQVSAGSAHSCAVRSSGELECWGYNNYGQADAPAGRFIQVSAGEWHTCSVASGGAVECWGADSLYGTSFARGHAPQAQSASLTARIAARRLDDGRIEFALHAPNERRMLPGTRHFPRNAPIDRWLSASTIDYHGEPLGGINARRLADGRTEFSFVTPEGERLLPSGRLLPANPSAGWKRSTEIEIPLPGCRLSDPVENGFTFPTRNVTIDDSGDVYRVTGVPLKWTYTPAAKWLRIGSDVRYLVCGDEPPTDQEYDRALFTAGYYYSTDPDGDSAYLFAVTEGLESAENGYQAYLDHFEALRWVTGFNTVVQIVHVGLAVGVAPGSVAGLLTQHSAHPAAARVIGETLIPTLTDVVLDEALHLSQEALDAVQQQPEEVVKNLAWNYVVDARAWGNSWERETHDGREGAQVRRVDTSKPTNPPTYKFVTEYGTLHFDTAQLLNRIELDIALGAAGSQLNAVLKEEERQLWKDAFLGTIPLLGDVVSLYDSFQNIYESLEQRLFSSLSEQLEAYPPYKSMKNHLQRVAGLVEQRQQDVIERLGIHAGNLQ